ncbi:MAG: hypothetical protein WDW36_004025 [Sanguina aurantia]
MALAPDAPAWARQLEEAGSILNGVVTPFFHEITHAIGTGTLSALDARVLLTSRSLATAMTSIYRLLTQTTAWFDNTTGARAGHHTLNLVRQQGLMMDACFAAIAASLTGAHNPTASVTNSRYMLSMSTAFTVFSTWAAAWPLDHLLGNSQRLASLDRLLRSVLQLSRALPGLRSRRADGEQLVIDAVSYAGVLLDTIMQLPAGVIPRTLAALPPTLLPHIFHLMDEQLPSLVRTAHLKVHKVLVCLKGVVSVLATRRQPLAAALGPALAGCCKHMVVVCTTGFLSRPANRYVSPAQVEIILNLILRFLLYDLECDTASPFSTRAAGLRHSSSSDGGGSSSSSSRDPPRPPTVSDVEYFRALCLCTASCSLPGSEGNCLYANSLLLAELERWRTSDDGTTLTSTLTVGGPDLECLLSLLRFVSRQAQLRLQPAARLRARRQMQAAQVPAVLDGDNLIVQRLLLDTCSVVMQLTGPKLVADHVGATLRHHPTTPVPKAVQTSLCLWAASPGAAAATESLLRDPHMRGLYIRQHNSAHVALSILGTAFDPTLVALSTRVSLAATLRKLMHPAAAPMWAAASKPPCTVWAAAGQCSEESTENCLLVIGALSSSWDHAMLEPPGSETKEGAAVGAFRLRLSRDAMSAPVCKELSVRLSAVRVATHVQLCRSSGNARLGVAAYQNGGALSGVAIKLLNAPTASGLVPGLARAEVSLMASSWEGFAIADLQGRLLPGCSHWGCTNLQGGAEAALPTRLCSRCRRARYCCDGCQRAAWVGGHREVCSEGH